MLVELYYNGFEVFSLIGSKELWSEVVRGSYSNWSQVTPGVPQGRILGPILFLMCINDLSNEVESSIKLFADDTKVYREIHNVENDTLLLQSDLDHMSIWANYVSTPISVKWCRSHTNGNRWNLQYVPFFCKNTESGQSIQGSRHNHDK